MRVPSLVENAGSSSILPLYALTMEYPDNNRPLSGTSQFKLIVAPPHPVHRPHSPPRFRGDARATGAAPTTWHSSHLGAQGRVHFDAPRC